MMARLRVLAHHHAPHRSFSFFSLYLPLSLLTYSSLLFYSIYREDYDCFIYCATLRLGPLTPPPSGDHDLLSHQLNASRLKKKPGPILISCYLFRSCFFTLFPFWPGSPSCFLRGSLLRCDCCMNQSPRRKSMWRQKVVHGYVKKKIGEKKGGG